MSKETPKDDPRHNTDQGSRKQTDKPWKGNPEKEQRSEAPRLILKNGTKPTRIDFAAGDQDWETVMGLAQ